MGDMHRLGLALELAKAEDGIVVGERRVLGIEEGAAHALRLIARRGDRKAAIGVLPVDGTANMGRMACGAGLLQRVSSLVSCNGLEAAAVRWARMRRVHEVGRILQRPLAPLRAQHSTLGGTETET
jgi:hypothetical protein